MLQREKCLQCIDHLDRYMVLPKANKSVSGNPTDLLYIIILIRVKKARSWFHLQR
jgi:hypothetical protein